MDSACKLQTRPPMGDLTHPALFTAGPSTPNQEPPVGLWRIVLAAGASSRMGQPKALIDLGAGPLLTTHVRAHQTWVERTVVVFGHAAAHLKERWAAEGALVFTNEAWEAGPAGSLRIGLGALPPHTDALVTPVDCPPVRDAVIGTLLDAVKGGGPLAALPCANGEPGHPVWLSATAVAALLAAPTLRLDHFLAGLGERCARVEVGDDAVLWNLNTPADAAAYRAGLPPRLTG